jgi:hypothetical protein
MAKGIERITALMIAGTVHFFKEKKMGRRRIVYPVHEMGEASSDAMIPSPETYSGFSMLSDVFRFDQINRIRTRITLIMMPVDMLLNLAVKPKMELFPGMMIVSA